MFLAVALLIGAALSFGINLLVNRFAFGYSWGEAAKYSGYALLVAAGIGGFLFIVAKLF